MIPLASIKKILKENGANRVSEEGVIALRDELELYAANVAKTSVKLAAHAGRKTVKKSDISLAI